MCTVTFIPQKEGFILTSNRDEAPARAAETLFQEMKNGVLITYPKDEGAGGTWVAASSSGRVVCLLNGAYEKHERTPPYKRSRGLMVLSFFEYKGVADFVSQYDFEGMEPFTFLMVEHEQLWVLRWMGAEMSLKQMDEKSRHIWSSATLYDSEMQKKRNAWFEAWEEKEDYSAGAILDFHQYAGEGNPEIDIVMNRNNIVRSISITQILMTDTLCMSHLNLLDNTTKKISLNLNNEKVCS